MRPSTPDSVAAVLRALRHGPRAAPDQPWLGWLLLCLCRQRARQTWLVQVAEQRLADVDDMDGDVPGLAGWRYYYHGSGLCLSGPGNEHLDMDFDGTGGQTIDPYFFAARVTRLDPPPPPEARLREWFPHNELMVSALDDLRNQGAIGHPESTHRFRLHPDLEQAHEDIAALDFADPTVEPHWREHLGAGVDDRFRHWVRARLNESKRVYSLLPQVSHVLDATEIESICLRQLKGPVNSAAGAAIEYLETSPSDHTAAVRAFLARATTEHHPFAPCRAARYLLTRGVDVANTLDIVERLAQVKKVEGYGGNPFEDDWAALLLEYAPDRALPAVRKALRGNTPMCVERISALLCLLDQRWCHRELEAAIRESTDKAHLQRYRIAALTHSRSAVAQARARALSPPVDRDPNGIGYTSDEVTIANMDWSFARATERMRPLAERLDLPEDYGA